MANDNLGAVAPELLSSLKRLLSIIGNRLPIDAFPEAKAEAVAVIAMAEGAVQIETQPTPDVFDDWASHIVSGVKSKADGQIEYEIVEALQKAFKMGRKIVPPESVDMPDIAAIRARMEAATPLPPEVTASCRVSSTSSHTKRVRYDHGGGRMFVDGSTRDLIVDVYNEGDREFYFSALDDVRSLLSLLP